MQCVSLGCISFFPKTTFWITGFYFQRVIGLLITSGEGFYFSLLTMSGLIVEVCAGPASPGPGRNWFPGPNSMYTGAGREPGGSRAGAGRKPGASRAQAGHIFYFPGPRLPAWSFVGWQPGLLGYVVRDLENPGYFGCSAYLNYIGRNMKYLPIKLTKAVYLWKRI